MGGSDTDIFFHGTGNGICFTGDRFSIHGVVGGLGAHGIE